MQNISVYDIGEQRWYQQQAKGDVPSWRSNGCAVVVSAPDSSSHSIYVFGGWGATTTEGNDGNVYVLSIPSFTWIRVTLDADQRSRHQCHLMGNHHMLVVGGIKPYKSLLQPKGLVGCDSDSKFRQGLGVFSLNSHTWTTSYDPVVGATPYRVHESISRIIGGNATGGATKQQPDVGFSSEALRNLMRPSKGTPNTTTTALWPSTTPHQSSPSSLSKAAIAGTAVGVAVSAIGIAVTIWYLFHRRSRFHQNASSKDLVLSKSLQPRSANEIYAGPAGQELRGGTMEDSLARMYQSHEVPASPQIYEMATSLRSYERPKLLEHRTTNATQRDTLDLAVSKERKQKERRTQKQTRKVKD
ncbi:MAG: hypothetical protein Q9223_004343 [Gallowayella weberi]